MAKLYNQEQYSDLRRKLRKEMPKGEKLLWSRIRNKQLGFKFRRQYGVGKYVLDFYCPSLRLCIEVDGITHEGNLINDLTRQKCIESVGIIVLRFRSDEVMYDLERVVQQIYYVSEGLNKKPPSNSLLRKEGEKAV